jgi:putative methyltransferase (TIGR04325 family)
MNLSPIAFFVYNRPFHTILTLNNLLKNNLSKYSDIIIFSDAPKNNLEFDRVSLVRKIINNIDGFRSKKIIYRNKNYGLSKNFISGINEVFKTNDKIIVLEDDNIVSKNFLDFINCGLNIYKNEESVAAINGYSYPVYKKISEDSFFLKGADTWGWGTWRRAWKKVIFEPKKILEKIKYLEIHPYKKNILIDKIKKKNDSYTIMFDLSMQYFNMLTLYPTVSMTKNIGLDGSGRHNKIFTNDYDVKINTKKFLLKKIDIKENLLIKKKLDTFFSNLVKENLTDFIKKKFILFLKKILPDILIKKYKSFFLKNINFIVNNSDNNFYNYLDKRKYILKDYNNYLLSKKIFLKTFKDNKLVNIQRQNFFSLNIILEIFHKQNNVLNLIEFGGSLGSKYLNFKKLISNSAKELHWSIVEQNNYVDIGKKNIQNREIKFINDINSAFFNKKNNILIFSNSLQYKKNPYEILNRAINSKNIKYILFESLPLTKKVDHILLQKHYDTDICYSINIFNWSKLKNFFKDRFIFKKIQKSDTNIFVNNKNIKYFDLFIVRK